MPIPEFIKAKKFFLRNDPELDEKWVHERIKDDPSILGLGDLVLKDAERPLPKSGRLDLLLQDSDTARRYEVEVQLGKSDESHIIRAIEYWDIERRRYPQYDHCAVLVAEDITSRFLNVVGLFQGSIPLIAIQMSALRINEMVALTFTTVLDELPLGLVDEDEEIAAVADRDYWVNKATKATVALADRLFGMIKEFAPDNELKYNKFYIGLASDGQPNNFAIFKPRKNNVNLEIRLAEAEELTQRIEDVGLDVMDYQKRWGKYRIRLTKADIEQHGELLTELMKLAFQESKS